MARGFPEQRGGGRVALRWHRLAADHEQRDTQVNLGAMHRNGEGICPEQQGGGRVVPAGGRPKLRQGGDLS